MASRAAATSLVFSPFFFGGGGGKKMMKFDHKLVFEQNEKKKVPILQYYTHPAAGLETIFSLGVALAPVVISDLTDYIYYISWHYLF